MKCKCSIFISEDHDNSTTWQIDNLDKLMTEINNNLKKILSMILDIQKIYIKYLKQTNKADKQNNRIWIQALKLEQDLYISNKKRE